MPIIRSISPKGASFGASVKYVMRSTSQSKALHALLHNFLGLSPEDTIGIIQAFEENDQFRRQRSNGVILYHEIVSFAEENRERLENDPEILLDLARKYLELRCPDSLAIANIHQDTPKPHFHVLISGNKFMSQESSRITKEQFAEVKQKYCEYQLEQYPELVDPLIEKILQKVSEADKNPLQEFEIDEQGNLLVDPDALEIVDEFEASDGFELTLDLDKMSNSQTDSVEDETAIISPYVIPSPYWNNQGNEDEGFD